jgi:hypothetical protein
MVFSSENLLPAQGKQFGLLGPDWNYFPYYDMGWVVTIVNEAQNGYDGPQSPKHEAEF